mmetsp:Transcript_6917/g.7908  ORF Transcript_6917/g.7908 Transcript_6917/m.7908 type:complete len:80 (+) Transcript_6917:346-585(+)
MTHTIETPNQRADIKYDAPYLSTIFPKPSAPALSLPSRNCDLMASGKTLESAVTLISVKEGKHRDKSAAPAMLHYDKTN